MKIVEQIKQIWKEHELCIVIIANLLIVITVESAFLWTIVDYISKTPVTGVL